MNDIATEQLKKQNSIGVAARPGFLVRCCCVMPLTANSVVQEKQEMSCTRQTRSILLDVAVTILCIFVICSVARGQDSPLGTAHSAAPALLQQMVGIWDVQQQMWTGPDAEAIDLPPAIAARSLVQGVFSKEVMTPAQESGQASFTRIAYLNYNPVSRRFEYFSLDTRAPQMMTYQSEVEERSIGSGIKFSGGRFVAAKWGQARNVAFNYRLEVGKVKDDHQVVTLYLTPLAGQNPKEFLAFKYVYARRQ